MAAIKVTRPEIYYGELANDYVFVKSGARELDYPAGDQNIYTQYSGSGGVSIGSLWRKLIFSAHFATLRIALSEDIVRGEPNPLSTADSRASEKSRAVRHV